MTKKAQKALDNELTCLFHKHGSNIEFSIFDLGKIRKAGLDAHAAGLDPELAIVAAIAQYRTMCPHGVGVTMVCGECLTTGRTQIDRDRATKSTSSWPILAEDIK